MKYGTGDIVRFKHGKGKKDGLHEITGVYHNKIYDYSVTNDECNSEYLAFHDDLIFVCSYLNRKDV